MTTQIQSISSIEEFIPHGMCLLWQPNLLFLHVISEAIITLSYYSIPIALVYFVVKRRAGPKKLNSRLSEKPCYF